MLLVNSFTCYWCCYVGESMYWNMLVWTCEICMKHVLLWSSPSSQVGIQLCGLLLDAAVFHYAGCYAGCYDVFICIRGDGLRDERKLVPHVVESI